MLYTGIYHTFEQKDFVAKYSEKKNHWTRQLLTLFSALKHCDFTLMIYIEIHPNKNNLLFTSRLNTFLFSPYSACVSAWMC